MNCLKLEGEASLSFLCGMLSVSGSSSYLNEKKSSKKAVQCSFVQKIRTCDERINVTDDAIRDCYSTETGDEGTHVVIGISWGVNTAVTLTYENNEDRSKDEIEGKLKASLEKLEKFSVSGKVEGGEKWLDEDNSTVQEMHVKVYADVLPNEEGAPRSLEEAMELIYNMPRRVAATGGGRAPQQQVCPSLYPVPKLLPQWTM
uniref:SNTX MACPF/CDC-like domain-containing protein n=1 Tax=Plectus sambesii TaxID=2011161 RepID=A0A914URY3_9BILA